MNEHTPIHLNALLARAGYGGRRETTKIIAAGRVQVNGQPLTNPLAPVLPDKDHVRVDGKLIKKLWPLVYLMMHKPPGTITATTDQYGRQTVYDLLGRFRQVVQAVGRLDFDTEGLLLFTNDGNLAHFLTSPTSQVPKTYQVKLKGHPSELSLNKLRRGVNIGGYLTAPAKVKDTARLPANTWLRITITEGKYRQIKRMLEVIGHPALKLIRLAYGPLELGDLKSGQFRHLRDEEVNHLRALMKK